MRVVCALSVFALDMPLVIAAGRLLSLGLCLSLGRGRNAAAGQSKPIPAAGQPLTREATDNAPRGKLQPALCQESVRFLNTSISHWCGNAGAGLDNLRNCVAPTCSLNASDKVEVMTGLIIMNAIWLKMVHVPFFNVFEKEAYIPSQLQLKRRNDSMATLFAPCHPKEHLIKSLEHY